MITQEKYENLVNWFEGYVDSFRIHKDCEYYINQKYEHTKNVIDAIEKIANSINLNEEEIIIALVIALFHDVSRFYQYYKYRTFNDGDSINHGAYSVEIIKENKLLEGIDDYTKDVIYQAIKYHNMMRIPKECTDEVIIKYSKMIRDADKLDIFRILIETYENNIDDPVAREFKPNDSKITRVVYDTIMNSDVPSKKILQTENDCKVMRLQWVEDLNYNISFELTNNMNYLDKIYNSLNCQDYETKKLAKDIYEKLLKYINEKLKNKGENNYE